MSFRKKKGAGAITKDQDRRGRDSRPSESVFKPDGGYRQRTKGNQGRFSKTKASLS